MHSNYAVGYNNVKVEEATKRQIPVGNTPGENFPSKAKIDSQAKLAKPLQNTWLIVDLACIQHPPIHTGLSTHVVKMHVMNCVAGLVLVCHGPLLIMTHAQERHQHKPLSEILLPSMMTNEFMIHSLTRRSYFCIPQGC